MLFDGKQPGDIWVDLNTHTHANWVFTKPGTYLVKVAIDATGTDKTERSAEAVLRFSVGDSTDEQAARDTTWPGAESSDKGDASASDSPSAAPSAASTGAASKGTESAKPAAQEDANEQADGASSLPWVAGGVALVVIAGVVVALVMRRQQRMTDEVFNDAE